MQPADVVAAVTQYRFVMDSFAQFATRAAGSIHGWGRKHWQFGDAIFAVVVTALTIQGLYSADLSGSERAADGLGYFLATAMALPLIWRRRAPIAVLAAIVAATVPIWVLDYASSSDGSPLIALYAVTAHCVDRRRAWVAAGVAIATLTVVAAIGVIVDSEDLTVSNFLNIMVFLGAGAGFGEMMYSRRSRIATMQEQLNRAEEDRIAEAERAVARERIHIAREMHDVVAHGMSVVAVQAAAAQRVVRSQPDAAIDALKNIENMSRTSLGDMRRMLSVLREGSEEAAGLAPQPVLSDVQSLVDHCNDVGVATKLQISGEARELPPTLDVAGFRIVQEALTNVIKHAGSSAEAIVTLAYGSDALGIDVIDNGRGAATMLTATGSTNGLIGIRERVELFDGEFAAGPRGGGGYQVRVRLPIDDSGIVRPLSVSNS